MLRGLAALPFRATSLMPPQDTRLLAFNPVQRDAATNESKRLDDQYPSSHEAPDDESAEDRFNLWNATMLCERRIIANKKTRT